MMSQNNSEIKRCMAGLLDALFVAAAFISAIEAISERDFFFALSNKFHRHHYSCLINAAENEAEPGFAISFL